MVNRYQADGILFHKNVGCQGIKSSQQGDFKFLEINYDRL